MKQALTGSLVLMLFMLGGCEKLMRDMYEQPKYETFEAGPFFPDDISARPPVPDTLAREDVTTAQMPPLSAALLRRGRERFDIFCAPCHSVLGDGDGMLPRRGFPAPPSYHTTRLRDAPDRHFYDVISRGYGVMYDYAARIPVADRWAIVAYIRALQLSQHARLDELSPALREKLEQQP
jgi:mono/diheme cytochrome c family protein